MGRHQGSLSSQFQFGFQFRLLNVTFNLRQLNLFQLLIHRNITLEKIGGKEAEKECKQVSQKWQRLFTKGQLRSRLIDGQLLFEEIRYLVMVQP